jgi:two-component system phosphate regulon sensor histidine kinase PhoR
MWELNFEKTAGDLEARARILEEQIGILVDETDYDRVDSLCKQLGTEVSTRFTAVLPSGLVIGDSYEDPELMDGHADRPEIKEAFRIGTGNSMRFSRTLQQDMMYVAIPIVHDSRIVGVLRASTPVISLQGALEKVQGRILLVGFAILCIGATISLFVSRRISQPLEILRRGAQRFAAGDLSHRLPDHGSEEVAVLADALNQMAQDLDDRIRIVVQQRNELNAVLTSMVEGVLAIDRDLRIISINETAARFLGTNVDDARGKILAEAVRNADLQSFVYATINSTETTEDEIVLDVEEERILQAQGTLLHDETGNELGVLIVFNDVTKLRQLERVRRDFVANVSHELKTPVTSILGFVETLLDGAMNDKKEFEKFLRIIENHSRRLGTIIEDLLTLSRLDVGNDTNSFTLRTGRIADVVNSAAHICQSKAAERNVRINIDVPEDLEIPMNPNLLEQGVVNLLDNAIKYSDIGETVRITASETEFEINISVIDQGPGIDPAHVHRIFERFYRVDKARSRNVGGTGLGLSIVKHIAQVHGGRATVKSFPGAGSTFSIHIPKR